MLQLLLGLPLKYLCCPISSGIPQPHLQKSWQQGQDFLLALQPARAQRSAACLSPARFPEVGPAFTAQLLLCGVGVSPILLRGSLV